MPTYRNCLDIGECPGCWSECSFTPLGSVFFIYRSIKVSLFLLISILFLYSRRWFQDILVLGCNVPYWSARESLIEWLSCPLCEEFRAVSQGLSVIGMLRALVSVNFFFFFILLFPVVGVPRARVRYPDVSNLCVWVSPCRLECLVQDVFVCPVWSGMVYFPV